MGFLHGVLEGVKNENEVTTYDNMMSDKLKNVLDLLTKNIGSGREGLAASVAEVKRWLEGYNSKVEALTNNVTSKLGELSSKLSSPSGTYYTSVSSDASKKLGDQLRDWTTAVSMIENEIDELEKYKINELDSMLRENLLHEIKPVKKVIQHVKKGCHDREFAAKVRDVDMAFKVNEERVRERINEDTQNLLKTAKTKFEVMDSQIKIVEVKRTEDVATLKNFVNKLEMYIAVADEAAKRLQQNYTSMIVDELGRIDPKAHELSTTEISTRLGIACTEVSIQLHKLDSQLKTLRSAYITVIKDINAGLSDLKGDLNNEIDRLKKGIRGNIGEYVNKYVGLVKKSVGEIKSAMNYVDKDGKENSKLHQEAKSVQTNIGQLDEELNKGAKGIGGAISVAVSGVEGALQGLNIKVQGDLSELKRNINQRVCDKVIENVRRAFRSAAEKAPTQGGSDSDDIAGQMIHEFAETLEGSYLSGWVSKARGVLTPLIANMDDNTNPVTFEGLKTFLGNFAATHAIIVGKHEKSLSALGALKADLNTKVEELIGKNEETIKKNIPSLMPTYYGEIQKNDGRTTLKDKIDDIKKTIEQYFVDSAVSDQSKFKLTDSIHFGAYDTYKNKALTSIEQVLEKIEKLEKVYPDIAALDTNLNIALKASIGSQLSNEVEIHNSVDARVEEKVNGVNFKPLDPLLNRAAEIGIEVLNRKVAEIHHEIDGISREIRPRIAELHKNDLEPKSSGAIQQKIIDLQHSIDVLKPMVSGVHNIARTNIKTQVEELKSHVANLKSSVVDINKYMNEVDDALKRSIETAQTTVSEANQTFTKHIKSLQDDLSQTAERAFDSIYSAVKSLFAEGHICELEFFNELIIDQRNAILTIIDADLMTGTKRLLREMNEHNQTLLHIIDNTDMSIVASYVDVFLMEVTKYMQIQAEHADVETEIIKDVKLLLMICRNVFIGISDFKHFNHEVLNRISKLSYHVSRLQLVHVPNSKLPVLAALKKGVERLIDELRKQYLSAYSSEKFDVALTEAQSPDTKQVAAKADETADTIKLTAYGKKCAQVFITCVRGLCDNLTVLKRECHHGWKEKTIKLTNTDEKGKLVDNPLGVFLKRFGYRVSEVDKQEGELRNIKKCDGNFITTTLGIVKASGSSKKLLLEVLDELCRNLKTYYEVCHIQVTGSPKYPSNIRDMLGWMCGLPYTAVFPKVSKHCVDQLRKEVEGAAEKSKQPDPIISSILQNNLLVSLSTTCDISFSVLVAICGNGRGFDHADYPYVCNFFDNSRGFHYPTDVPSLFDMLTDVCRRLLSSLNFLRIRCKLTASSGNGWADCEYGQAVVGYEWPCKDHSKSKANDQPNCQPKSPLQAHLMDRLPGCLPHNLTSVGCKAECDTCSKTSTGQLCTTPMGFWDLSDSASTCGTGKQIADALGKLCKDAESPLCALLHCLQCLAPSPPKSLADMFSLFCQLFRLLKPADSYRQKSAQYMDDAALKSHFTSKTVEAAFPLPKVLHDNFKNGTLTNAIADLYYSYDDHKESPPKDASKETAASTHSDLSSLTLRSKCSKSFDCSPYLQPLYFHAYHTYPQKHAAVYLSWIVHNAWRFWDLLNDLLSAFQQISCKHSGCSKCNCKSGNHGDMDACKCISIAHCGSVLSTFYQYGFTFGKTDRLMIDQKEKLCSSFYSQLNKVIASKHFGTLFTVIDDFIFAIRAPFIWLNVALWLLSLLYLTHIMVIRLDLLHIKSHLHSPSSHRIAAQSLLAASRVNKLNRVFYLQP